ncbi:MAG: TonB-dependent receptor [Acidobacteriota bacterium]
MNALFRRSPNSFRNAGLVVALALSCGCGLWAASAPTLPPELEARIKQALAKQQQFLTDASAEISSKTKVMGPQGPQVTETSEKVYFGKPGQIRRDILSSSSSGTPGPEGQRQGRWGNPAERFVRILDSLEPREILARIEKFEAADQDDQKGISRPGLKIRIQPKLERFQIEKAFLWVDPNSGLPTHLDAQFGLGFFLRNAQLEVDFEQHEPAGPSLPSQVLVHIKTSMPGRPGGPGGFMGPGGGPEGGEISIEISRTYSHYRFGLNLDEQFFAAAARSNGPFTRNAARGPNGSRTSEQDPFEEISLLPNQARPSETQNSSLDEVVFIQGASRQSAHRGDQREVLRDILGMERGTGGPPGSPGSRGLGGGGFGGGGFGGGGFGGGRGMRIAGSRANSIHGDLQFGFSGSALDARPYSLTGEEAANPSYDRWSAGITLGGPLPGAGSNAGFFQRRGQYFVNFNTTRGSQLSSAFASVPTLLERQGDFSATSYRSGPLAGSAVQIFDPATGLPYSDSRIPQNELNPTALGLLSFIPEPNRDDPFLNYYIQESLVNERDQLNTRLNFPISERFNLAGGYNYSRGSGDSFNVFPDLAGRQESRGHNFDLSANTPVRPGLIQNVRLRYNRSNSRNLNPFAFQRDVSADLGIARTSPSPVDYGMPSLAFTNYSSLNDGASSVNVRESVTASESWLFATGTHFFRIGADYSWLRYNLLGSPNGAGSIDFAGIATSDYIAGEAVPGSGYDFADFLLGLGQSSEIQYGNPDHYLRGRQFSLFLNDNWRLHSRFTLQWGLRYDYVSPIVEKYDRMSNLDLGPGFLTAETVVPGSVGAAFGPYPRAMIRGDENNFAPRLGLAYRLRSGPKGTILRAEYGVFYPSDSYLRLARELIAQPPFGYTVQSIAEGLSFLPIEDAFAPAEVPAVANTYAVDPNFRLETVQNWGLSVQQALPFGLFASLGYAGSRGTGLELLRAPNRLTKDAGRLLLFRAVRVRKIAG